LHLVILCLSYGTAEKKNKPETILMGLRANLIVSEEQDAWVFS